MINYSIVMRRKNVADKESEKLAYATAQYNSVMTIDKFAAHIASHGSVYSRADIAAVLTLAVDCLYEQLLAGQKIELGDLGAFCISLNCKGADSAEEFNLVANRKQQAAVLKAVKAGDTSVDLTTGTTSGGSTSGGSDEPDNGDGGDNGGATGGNPL